jgi:uncharacterized protein YlxW (UPF0749 family)
VIDELTQIEINDIEKRILRAERYHNAIGPNTATVTLTSREARVLMQMATDAVCARTSQLEAEVEEAESERDDFERDLEAEREINRENEKKIEKLSAEVNKLYAKLEGRA